MKILSPGTQRSLRTRSGTSPSAPGGIDPKEVTAYLAGLADQIEYADADRADLRSEVERLRTSATEAEQQAHMAAHAVGLLSEAQQIADTLVAEAQQYAEDLIEQARRDTLLAGPAVDSRPSMARLVAASSPQHQ